MHDAEKSSKTKLQASSPPDSFLAPGDTLLRGEKSVLWPNCESYNSGD